MTITIHKLDVGCSDTDTFIRKSNIYMRFAKDKRVRRREILFVARVKANRILDGASRLELC